MKNYERAFALILVLGAATAKADVVDLDGQTVSKTGAEFKSAYNNNTIENGTVNLTGEMGGNTGTYTIGHDAIVTCGIQQYFNGNFTINIVNGGEYRQTSSYFVMPFRYGQDSLTLDNGKITSTSTASAVSGGGIINFGYCWNNRDNSKNIDLVNKVAIKNGSTISLSSGNLWLGGVKAKGSDTRTLKTAKTDFVVTNSSIVVTKGQICFCSNYDTWLSDKANSYVHATFGPGSEITTGQFYVNGKCPTAAISFDGATIHWTGNNSSFIGHSSVGDVYTIGEGGLTIDIPSGKTLTVDANASALKGTGGITKVGAGTVNWNKVSTSGSDMHLFTGPLVVSNGVWSSSVGYKASAFRAEGGRLTLSGRLEAPEVELAATDGGTLTLAGAVLTDDSPSLALAGVGTTDYFTRDKVVAEYNLDTLTIGGGAVINLDADATGADTISATTLNVTATAANPALVKIEFLRSAAGEMEITLFDTTDGSEFNVETTFNGSPIQNVKSVSGGKLVVTVIVPTYTWNGTQANWGDADAWEKDGANATWADGNNARFAADGAEAMLAADVSALSVKFEGSATVSGTAELAASEISVAAGKEASVLAPVAGILTKTGEGTLSLGASRTEDTTLAGGTLSMAPGATVDASKLTLGVLKDTPVTFDYGGQALSLNFTAISPAGKAAGGNVTLANGDYTVPAALRVWNGSLTITSDTRVTMESSAARWVCVGGNTADTSEASTDIDALLVIDGGSITNNTGNHLGVGDFGSAPSKGAVIVKNGGTYWGKNNIYVAQGCEGHLTIEGEGSSATASRLYFCGESRDQVGEDGYVVLSDGGALSVKNVTYNKGNANGYLKFDGGALKAAEAGTLVSAHDRLFVSVAARGGTIDAGGFVVTVEEPILADENSNGGGMKFVGGGTVTLAAGNTYTGTTTVELGTVVKVASASDIGGGFAMTLKDGQQPTDGIYTLVEITGNGTFSNDVLAGVEAPSGGRFELSKSGKSILYFFGYPGFVWIGGASGSLADPTGWANGMVPGASDDCFIGNDVATSLSTASGFAPKSITFTAASAPVTISGDVAISGIAAVTNLSAEVPEIACPLTFAGNYRVHCSSAAVNFSGGATATYPAPDITDNAPTRALTGTITFTEDWTAAAPMSNMYTVPDGSKLYGKHLTGSVDGKTFLCVKAGGHAEFDSILTGKSLGRVSVQGELVVKGKWVAAATANYSHIGEDNSASETGTLRVSGLWKGDDDNEMNKDLFVKIKNLYIGKDGLGAKRSHYSIRFQASEIGGYLIHATDDFEIFGPLNTSNPTDWGVSFEQPVTLDTAGHKITWTAGAQGEGTVTKTGEGTLVMNPHGSDMTNTWTVAGGTLALAKSAATGTGAIAVNAGATLQVAVSGTVSLGGALSLKNGAALGFNWTEKNIAPVLDLNGKDVTFAADAAKNVVLKLSMASDAISPPNGRRVLTTGGKFAGATITLVPDAPTWVRDYGVDENGNIYVEGGHGFVIKLR